MKLKKTICSIALMGSLVLASAQAAYADVTVVYKMTSKNGGGQQTIYYADKQHVRMDMSGGAGRTMTMLKRGDKVYAITGKVVQDLSQLSQMMGAMGMGKQGGNKPQAPIKFEDTGKTETIAGLRGKVYRFVEKGKRHEVVLAQNKDLQNAVLGIVEITKAATSMMPFDATSRIQQDASIKNMALLRLDNTLILQSMNTHAVPAETFKLPSKPQQMGGMGALMKGVLGN